MEPREFNPSQGLTKLIEDSILSRICNEDKAKYYIDLGRWKSKDENFSELLSISLVKFDRGKLESAYHKSVYGYNYFKGFLIVFSGNIIIYNKRDRKLPFLYNDVNYDSELVGCYFPTLEYTYYKADNGEWYLYSRLNLLSKRNE